MLTHLGSCNLVKFARITEKFGGILDPLLISAKALGKNLQNIS